MCGHGWRRTEISERFCFALTTHVQEAPGFWPGASLLYGFPLLRETLLLRVLDGSLSGGEQTGKLIELVLLDMSS